MREVADTFIKLVAVIMGTTVLAVSTATVAQILR
jgi:hypothetical protein